MDRDHSFSTRPASKKKRIKVSSRNKRFSSPKKRKSNLKSLVIIGKIYAAT